MTGRGKPKLRREITPSPSLHVEGSPSRHGEYREYGEQPLGIPHIPHIPHFPHLWGYAPMVAAAPVSRGGRPAESGGQGFHPDETRILLGCCRRLG
jgi:hypothetical protein